MLRPSLLFVLLLLIVAPAAAQVPNWEWVEQCGNSASDKALDVEVDDAGDVYVCGYFNDNGTFGNIQLTPNAFSKEAFLAKMDSTGNFIWARSGGGYFDDRALGVHVDPQNNVIITGTFWSSITFGNYTLGGSADHVFVVKYDPSGNIIWARSGGGDGDDHGFDMVTNENGDIFITGFLSTHYGPPVCTATFGNLPPFSYNDSIAFVARMSSAGQWLWVKTFDGTDVQRENDIAIDSSGNIYVVGGFYGNNRQFGNQVLNSTNGSRDIFVVKYDENGNFLWVKSTGSTLDDRANGVTIDPYDQMLYITGEFRDKVGFDGDSINNNGGPNGRDIFVAKMDTDGNWIWAKKAGSNSGDESGRAITINDAHNVFVTGNCKGQVKFGNDTNFATGSDSVQVFAAAIDTTGDWVWAVQCGGANEDRGYGITVDSACNVYFCGYGDGPTFTAGPDSWTSYGRKDGFIARLSQSCFDYQTDPPVDPDPDPDACTIDLPNVFTPDQDGVNDIWLVKGDSCIDYGSWYIYNRWGNLVYYTTDISAGWDGRDFGGKPVNDGVYYFMLEAVMTDRTPVKRTGFLTVVR